MASQSLIPSSAPFLNVDLVNRGHHYTVFEINVNKDHSCNTVVGNVLHVCWFPCQLQKIKVYVIYFNLATPGYILGGCSHRGDHAVLKLGFHMQDINSWQQEQILL